MFTANSLAPITDKCLLNELVNCKAVKQNNYLNIKGKESLGSMIESFK